MGFKFNAITGNLDLVNPAGTTPDLTPYAKLDGSNQPFTGSVRATGDSTPGTGSGIDMIYDPSGDDGNGAGLLRAYNSDANNKKAIEIAGRILNFTTDKSTFQVERSIIQGQITFLLQSSIAITIGEKDYLKIPYDFTITQWEVSNPLNTGGNIFFDIEYSTDTVSWTSITGSGTRPNLIGVNVSSGSDFTEWSKIDFTAGVYIRPVLTQNDDGNRDIHLVLTVTKT